MRLAVRLYATITDKPPGIPDAWPARAFPIGDEEAPPTNYTAMTEAEYVLYRATHQSEFDAFETAHREYLKTVDVAGNPLPADDE